MTDLTAPTAHTPDPVLSIQPVTLPAPQRGQDLQVRISAPATGEDLPVMVFSYGFSLSGDDYAPLVDSWTANGIVVVQPTHLDSATIAMAPQDPRTPQVWRSRIEDLRLVIDHLDDLEAAVPGLGGRVDRDRIIAAGHSWGATTASALVGARVADEDGGPGRDDTDARVAAAVLLCIPGVGGEELAPFAASAFPFMKHPTFAAMSAPALIVAGEVDQSPLTTRGPEFFTDAYHLAPSPKSLLTVHGAQHSLGGIHGYARADTLDENPQRVALVGQVTLAYIHHALGIEEASWAAQSAALADGGQGLGRLESRP